MAVQPQYPASNVVLPADHSNRSGRPSSAVGNDNRSFLTPGLNLNSFLSKFQIHQPVVGGSNQLRIFNQLTGGRHAYPPQVNVAATHAENEGNVPAAAGGSRKRGREVGDDIASQWHQQHQQHQQHLLNVPNFHQIQTTGPGSVVNPQSTTAAAAAAAAAGGVSTGLRLAFENDRLRSTSPVSTSGRPEVHAKNLVASMAEDFSSHLQKERDEIEHLLKIQGEQVRQLLEEKRQRHCRQLIAAVELGFSRKLREKDLEAEKMKHHNQELLDRLQHMSAESINWQNKLRQSEDNVNILRSSLHQASQQQPYALNREQQSKEGCGDSEVDDCASSYVDDRIDAHARTFNENKELREQWTCRVCRCKDVSMLLLPCRHLCLCKDCEGQLDACPLCRAPKNASVEVYMS